jgi:hypothetical protein
MGGFEYNSLLLMEKIVFKNHFIKSKHRVLTKNKVDTHGAPVLQLIMALVLAPDVCYNHRHLR